jgi:chromate transporter
LSIITAAVVGVILNLTIYLGKAVLFPRLEEPDWFSLAWLLVSFLALFRFKLNMMLWIAISACVGLLYHFLN